MFPKNHPLFNAPRDIQAIAILAVEIDYVTAEFALARRLEKLAERGDRQAQCLILFAAKLRLEPQTMIAGIPETREQATGRLLEVAQADKMLTAQIIGEMFGVGLINKAQYDGLKQMIQRDFSTATLREVRPPSTARAAS